MINYIYMYKKLKKCFMILFSQKKLLHIHYALHTRSFFNNIKIFK